MEWQTIGRVQVLEELSISDSTQCLRVKLDDDETQSIIPGQYCLLDDRVQAARAFNYVSLPGRDRRCILAASPHGVPLRTDGPLLYRGPLGVGWPLPFGVSRLLVFACVDGILAVAAAIDEFACWLPWVQLVLVEDASSQACLPDDCRRWLHSLGLLIPPVEDCPLERLRAQLSLQLPDLVYCSAPAPLALKAARLCLWHGVPAYRIWIRGECSLPGAGSTSLPAAGGPVLRFDRLSGRI